MSVQELIDELNKVENKYALVCVDEVIVKSFKYVKKIVEYQNGLPVFKHIVYLSALEKNEQE